MLSITELKKRISESFPSVFIEQKYGSYSLIVNDEDNSIITLHEYDIDQDFNLIIEDAGWFCEPNNHYSVNVLPADFTIEDI